MQFERLRRWAMALVSLATFVTAATTWVYLKWVRSEVDLEVYRAGGRAVIHDIPLYDVSMHFHNLLFTYPVFSAVLFVPLYLTEDNASRVIHVAASMTALVIIAFCALHSRVRAPRLTVLTVALMLCAAVVPFEPVRETVRLGQINLLLVAAILVDTLLIRSPKVRGLLIGLVTGIKLTPAVFVLYLLATRQWRAAANAVAVFVVTVAIGFWVMPQQAWNFWTKHIFDAARTGNIWFLGNQSISGEVSRLLSDEHPPRVLTLGLSAIAVLAALWAAAVLHKHGERLLAVCAMGVASLLASPISWTHHWVWFLPCGVALASVVARWWSSHRAWSAAAAVGLAIWVAVFAVGPMWRAPSRLTPTVWGELTELHHTPGQALLASSFVLVGIVFLGFTIGYATVLHRRPSAAAPASRSAATARLVNA